MGKIRIKIGSTFKTILRRLITPQRVLSFSAKLYDAALKLTCYQRATNYIIRHLPFQEKDVFKVLDLGCGPGSYSLALLQKFPNIYVTALDLNPFMIKKIEKNLSQTNYLSQCELRLTDINIPSPDFVWNINLVVASGILEYVPLESLAPYLSTYVIPGGYLLNVPTKLGSLSKLFLSRVKIKTCSDDEMVELLKINGFNLLKIIELPLKFFPICFIKKAYLFQKAA